MKSTIRIILLVLIAFGLSTTNPTKNDFVDFAASQVKKNLPDLNFGARGESSGLEKMIAGFTNTMIATAISESTEYQDYFLFSVYKLDMKLARDLGVDAKDIKVLGFAGHFVAL